ncbi:unnamed protein product [Phytomonas sp. Hart1]|nr:unnamed protein product [Phytomonas sp. Hart1]|eukprot:CCW66374.1 unnamed protein product [Phytomonas sp. isolate Hart1]
MGSCLKLPHRKKYQFKDFILEVYPSNSSGKLNQDALHHLKSYVGSNPERVAPVCRKIYKLMCSHLRHRKSNNVMVSVAMLQFLIKNASVVDRFVSDCIEIVSVLLSTHEPRYKIEAAGILSILCHRLVIDKNGANSRRLIADSQDRFLKPLQQMCVDGIPDIKDHGNIQRSYAAIIALGHISRCLGSSSTEHVASRLFPILENLVSVLRSRPQGPMEEVTIGQQMNNSNYIVDPPISVELPESASKDMDILYVQACSFAVSTTAGCVTTTGIEDLLTRITAFMTTQKAWSVPIMAPIVFCALAAPMQERPIRPEFMVYRGLCELGIRSNDIAVHIGVLGALKAYLERMSVSDSRPRSIVKLIQAVITNSLLQRYACDHERLVRDMQNAVTELIFTLLQVIYHQRQALELQSVVESVLCMTLGTGIMEGGELAQKRSRTDWIFMLRCMTVVSPYVRTVPSSDRAKGVLKVGDAIVSFLYDSDDAARIWAVRILQQILAGTPTGRGALIDEPSMPLYVDERDATIARNWVHAMMWTTREITPQCVVQVADVTTAIMTGRGIKEIPFVFNLLCRLQQRCTDIDSHKECDCSILSNPGMMSALTRAWLHMIVVLLISCGRVYNIPRLVDYVTDIFHQRQVAYPSELSSHFESTLIKSYAFEDLCPTSGLKVIAALDGKSIILNDDPCEGPVKILPSFSRINSLIVEAERDKVASVFGATAGDAAARELQVSIDQTYLHSDNKLIEGSFLLKSLLPNSTISSTEADIDVPFTLQVPEARIAELRSIKITLVDSVSEVMLPRVELPLKSASNSNQIAEILDTYGVSASSKIFSVDTSTTPKQFFSRDGVQEGPKEHETIHNETVQSDTHHVMSYNMANDVLTGAEETSGLCQKLELDGDSSSEAFLMDIPSIHQGVQEYEDLAQLPPINRTLWISSLPSARLFEL